MVRAHPDPPDIALNGGLAQLGEHLLCKQGVVGSIPSSSTNSLMYKNLEASLVFDEIKLDTVFASSFLARLIFNKMEEVKRIHIL